MSDEAHQDRRRGRRRSHAAEEPASQDRKTPTKKKPRPETMSTDSKKLESEGDVAADFLEELLDIADLDGDIDMDVDGDRADGLDRRWRPRRTWSVATGDVLEALQELTRLAVLARDRRAQPADARRRRLPRGPAQGAGPRSAEGGREGARRR